MAVAFSPEQFERFITEVLARIAVTNPVTQAESQPNKRTIWDKGFCRLSKFAQGESAWPEWAFDFQTALGSQSVEMKQYLDVVEQRTEIITEDSAIQLDVERAKRIKHMIQGRAEIGDGEEQFDLESGFPPNEEIADNYINANDDDSGGGGPPSPGGTTFKSEEKVG